MLPVPLPVEPMLPVEPVRPVLPVEPALPESVRPVLPVEPVLPERAPRPSRRAVAEPDGQCRVSEGWPPVPSSFWSTLRW